MSFKTPKTILQQTIMMGLFYTGMFLIIEGLFFGEVASLFTAAITFFQSEDLLSQIVSGAVLVLAGIFAVGVSVLVATWLGKKNQFDTDERMAKLCRPFIVLFTVLVSFFSSIGIMYLLFYYGLF